MFHLFPRNESGLLFGDLLKMNSRPFRVFIFSAGVLLLITSSAKLVSAVGAMQVLDVDEPIFRISFRHIFWVAGLIELFIAWACFLDVNLWYQAGMVASLATNFVFYRLGLVWIGWHKPCSCMGNLINFLHIPPQTADTAMKIILAYLFIGSYITLFWLWRQRKKGIPALAPV